MEFLELAKKRYSVRKYKEQPVEKEKLDKILEAGRIAPTGANKQPQRLFVVQTPEAHEKLNKCSRMYNAPVVIIVCSDISEVWERPGDGKKIYDIDASIVTDHMMLQATELGLGTLWACWFKSEILKAEFNIPENLVPVNLLGIGYADCEAAPLERHDKMRKPLSETVTYY